MASSRAVSTWRQPASFAKDLAFKQRGLENASGQSSSRRRLAANVTPPHQPGLGEKRAFPRLGILTEQGEGSLRSLFLF